MSVAVGNEVPASLDVYCGLVVPVGLRQLPVLRGHREATQFLLEL